DLPKEADVAGARSLRTGARWGPPLAAAGGLLDFASLRSGGLVGSKRSDPVRSNRCLPRTPGHVGVSGGHHEIVSAPQRLKRRNGWGVRTKKNARSLSAQRLPASRRDFASAPTRHTGG